jgi:hypothetical protein
MMRKSLWIIAVVFVASLAPKITKADPTYLPSGVQTDVSVATVLDGGWSVCYSATYATPLGNDDSVALAGCTGSDLMLAAMVTGSSTFDLLAWAPATDVVYNTGTGNTGSTLHEANGVDWYYAPNWSWGFAPVGAPVDLNQCDEASDAEALCWHTINDVGGYRDGNIIGLNDSTAYTKEILEYSPTPEPGSIVLFCTGLLGVGLALRKRIFA